MADENQAGEGDTGMPNGRAFWAGSIGGAEQANALIERALEAASPNAIFQEPVVLGDTAVITCNELNVWVGVGYGGGGGAEGQGGGGGGGGGSLGRPVAVITIRPDGVKVEPIVDITKLGIAAFGTLLALIMMRGEVKRAISGR